MQQFAIKLAILIAALSCGVSNAKPFEEQKLFSFDWPGNLNQNADYYVSDKEVTWFAANFYCISHGWELVTPETFNAATLLKGFRELYDVTGKSYWSAGNRLANQKWVWGLDGEKLTYLNWNESQRDDSTSDSQKCMLLGKTADNLWNIDYCAKKHRFICQKFAEKAKPKEISIF